VNQFTYNTLVPGYQDAEHISLIERLITEVNMAKRDALLREMGRYQYYNYVSMPITNNRLPHAYSSDKITGMSATFSDKNKRFEYLQHNPPLNTFRLFEVGRDVSNR
jgi:ABC-type transport system substrate-binding protein